MKKDEQSNLLELVSKWELGEALKQMLGMAIPEGKLYETVSFSAMLERLKRIKAGSVSKAHWTVWNYEGIGIH
jgi:hypothetical protein